ncbi:MAG: hypothetical protein ACTS41_00905 [Candidatus Hodgkinia cicadicola]
MVCFTVGGVGFKLGARVWFRAVGLLWGGCCGTSCEVWYGDRLFRKAEVRRCIGPRWEGLRWPPQWGWETSAVGWWWGSEVCEGSLNGRRRLQTSAEGD